jgi:hypothetical protein
VEWVVAAVAGWYLEFCEIFAKTLATLSPTIFLVNLVCSENIADISSGVIGVDEFDTFTVCTSFMESIEGRMGCLIYVTEL